MQSEGFDSNGRRRSDSDGPLKRIADSIVETINWQAVHFPERCFDQRFQPSPHLPAGPRADSLSVLSVWMLNGLVQRFDAFDSCKAFSGSRRGYQRGKA